MAFQRTPTSSISVNGKTIKGITEFRLHEADERRRFIAVDLKTNGVDSLIFQNLFISSELFSLTVQIHNTKYEADNFRVANPEVEMRPDLTGCFRLISNKMWDVIELEPTEAEVIAATNQFTEENHGLLEKLKD